MDVTKAYTYLSKNNTINPGSFYSSGQSLALGVGKIFYNIRFPIYDEDENLFNTRSGLVFVLTHECDIDSNYERPFNKDVLICPIIELSSFVEEYSSMLEKDKLVSFLSNLSLGKVSRVLYIPTISKNHLPYGGLMYLNHICSTDISAFTLDSAEALCAVTAPGLQMVDRFLFNHFLRPKSQRLALGKI